jgi:alpha 1,3-glucosidase
MYEATITGIPVMRPMFMEADGLEAVDDQFMLGRALLHKPVTQASETSVSVALPADSIWYDFFSLAKVEPDAFSERAKMPVDLETIPLWVAGGSIVPLKLRQRRSSKAMLADPFTILVALDTKQSANGTVFIDDGASFEHELGAAYYMKLSYGDGLLTCRPADSFTLGVKSLAKTISTKVETIVLAGLPSNSLPSSATLRISTGSKQARIPVSLETDTDLGIIRVRMPPVTLSSAWTMEFEWSR